MIPQVELFLTTLKAGFEAISETLKFLQTPQGQKVIEQNLIDRANWDKFWKDAPGVISKFFKGEYF